MGNFFSKVIISNLMNLNQILLETSFSDFRGTLGLFNRDDAERLAPYVHGFSVMTYDYSNTQRCVKKWCFRVRS